MNQNYETSRIAVDAVAFTIEDKKLKIFLTRREKEPYKEKLELPGGLMQKDETAEQTLKRKLKEMTNSDNVFFNQFFTFTNPSRDPRQRAISVGFIALINIEKIKDNNNWVEYKTLKDLAFDHKEIIEKARKYLQENSSGIIAKQFMPTKFPINKLQEVYEVIEDMTYDNRNFRKKMISSNIVEETGQIETNVSHRPAKLFRFK
jgi:8-oxo-dGTP diphosphatase